MPQESEDTVLESKEETYSETLEIVPKEDDTLPLEKTTKGVKVVPESGEVSFDIDVSIPEKKTEVSTLETSVVEEVTETEEITEEYKEQEEDITSTETFKQSVEILPKVKPDEVSSQQTSVKIPVEETTEDYPIIEVPAPTEETLTEERETVDRKPQETSVDVTDASKQIQIEEVDTTLEGTKPEEVLYAETLEIAPKEEDTTVTEKTIKSIDIAPESGPVSLDIDISIPKDKTVSTIQTTVVEEVTESEEITEEYEEQEEGTPSTETFTQAVEILSKVKPDEVSSQQISVEIPVEETTENYPIVEVPAPIEETLTEERETIDRKLTY